MEPKIATAISCWDKAELIHPVPNPVLMSRWEGEKSEERELQTSAEQAHRDFFLPPLKLSEILRVVRSISRERNHKREHTSNIGFLFHKEYLHVGCGNNSRASEQTGNPVKFLSLMFLNGILPNAVMVPEQSLQHWASTGHLGHRLTYCLGLGEGSGPFTSSQLKHEYDTEPYPTEIMKKQDAKPAPIFC